MTMPQKPSPPSDSDRLTSGRGARLATRLWASPDIVEVQAMLLMVHGGGWHSGYFDPLAQFLVKKSKSLLVGSYDQAGCGYSEKEPTAPEGCFHIESMDWLVDDIFDAITWMKSEAMTINKDKGISTIPVFLLGESFGAIQVFQSVLDAPKRNQEIAGAMALGGLIRVHPSFMPPRPVVALLLHLAKCFPRWKTPAVDFSHSFDDAFGNKEWAKVARSDEPYIRVSPRPTLGMMSAIFSAGDKIMADAYQIATPILCIHGQRDCRCDIANVEEFCSKVKDHKAKLIVVDTSGHQLLQDVDQVTDAVMDHISEFLFSLL